MIAADIQFKETRDLCLESVVALYKSVGWSSAEKPEALHRGLLNSHSLVTAWDGNRLVGLGNAISDSHLVALAAKRGYIPEKIFFSAPEVIRP